ncbi:unnamed protein product [Auanema sp. JU1783]|nr:unnamed protein product [Auanema sp. JU1783]
MFDLVIYGATGFTGSYIVERLVTSSLFKDVKFAVAGRSESKLRKVLSDVSDKTGINIRSTTIIVADTKDEQSLIDMAKQTKVVLNAVGPYRLHGEPVVKAAVENGASHVDISGEPAFLEKMQEKYNETAKKNNVYIVGACGWDSIPCDLGINFLKNNFNGDLNHAETFVQLENGPEGYAINAGTYQTLILGISESAKDGLGAIRRKIMPVKTPRSTIKAPKRSAFWKIDHPEISGWALPFMGSDKSVVQRSQYFGYVLDQDRPAQVETYLRISSLLWASLFTVWITIFFFLCQFKPTRQFLQKYPDLCSFNLFKNAGPTKAQMDGASFTYWLIGTGYSSKKSADEQHTDKPDRRVAAKCTGPDCGYYATSGCILSSALTLIKDRQSLPADGGVYTTAAAFGKSKIYEYLSSFGVKFEVVSEKTLKNDH